jgi:hypothetical protein
MNHPTSV